MRQSIECRWLSSTARLSFKCDLKWFEFESVGAFVQNTHHDEFRPFHEYLTTDSCVNRGRGHCCQPARRCAPLKQHNARANGCCYLIFDRETGFNIKQLFRNGFAWQTVDLANSMMILGAKQKQILLHHTLNWYAITTFYHILS